MYLRISREKAKALPTLHDQCQVPMSLRSRNNNRCHHVHGNNIQPSNPYGTEVYPAKVLKRGPPVRSSLQRSLPILLLVSCIGLLICASFYLNGKILQAQNYGGHNTIPACQNKRRRHEHREAKKIITSPGQANASGGKLGAPSYVSRGSNNDFSGKPFERLGALELELGSILKQKVVSCRKGLLSSQKDENYTTDKICNTYPYINNVATNMNHFVIYNPSARDKFLCNGKLILGPKKWKLLKNEDVNRCGGDIVESTQRAHSFPYPPTYENRNQFPGIVVQSHAPDDVHDDSFSSNTVTNRVFSSSLDPSSEPCDVKCSFEPGTSALSTRYVYGTNWEFTYSMEGEVSLV